MTLPVYGRVAEGFEPVERAFHTLFEQKGEEGAAFAVVRDGESLVHLWGGTDRHDPQTLWKENTRSVIFSASKGLSAVALLVLTEREGIDLDRPVHTFWPGFEQNGKRDVTLRMLINHRAGLSAIDGPLRVTDIIDDPERVDTVLRAQAPAWKPGASQGYGATAWGVFVGALFPKLSGGVRVGQFLRDEVCTPLQADVDLGTPAEKLPQVATLIPTSGATLGAGLPHLLKDDVSRRFYARLANPSTYTSRAFRNPDMGPERLGALNDPALLSAELPWMNATASAIGLARIFAALANNGALGSKKIIKKASLQPLFTPQSWSYSDRVLGKPLGFSQGFQKEELHLFSPFSESFGHAGAGGSFAWADPVHRIGFAFVTRKMSPHVRSPRAAALCHALYQSLCGFDDPG